MKRNMLFLLSATMLITSIITQAQSIVNTCWYGVDSSTTATIKLEFEANDTLWLTSNQVPRTPISTYYVHGDTLEIEDIPGASSCGPDVGIYTYEINGDTIEFDLVSDVCGDRANALLNSDWYGCAIIGIDDNIQNIQYSAYPNPADEFLVISGVANAKNMTYQMNDIAGRLVQQGQLTSEKTTLDVQALEPGIYVIHIQTKPMITLRFTKR